MNPLNVLLKTLKMKILNYFQVSRIAGVSGLFFTLYYFQVFRMAGVAGLVSPLRTSVRGFRFKI